MSKKDMYIYGLTTAGGTCLVALMMCNYIANRDIPYYDARELKNARFVYEMLSDGYITMRDNTIYDARAEFRSSPAYRDITNRMDKVSDTNPEYQQLDTRLDSMENAFISNRLDNNKELDTQNQSALKALEAYEKLQQDSAVAAQMKSVPFKTRLNRNWNKMRIEYHNKKILQHQDILKKLQNTK